MYPKIYFRANVRPAHTIPSCMYNNFTHIYSYVILHISAPKPCRNSLLHLTCHMPRPSVLDFIKQVIFGEQHKSWSSSFCNFLHTLVSSSLTHPTTSLNTPFPNTLNATDQVALPYKTTGNITSFTSSHFNPAMEPSRTRPTFRGPPSNTNPM